MKNWIVISGIALFSGITGLALADNAKEVRELLEWGDNDMALERATAGLEKTPEDAELKFYHALALARTGENDEAIDAFQELAEQYPGHPEVHNNLAVLLAKEGDYEEARAALEAALATHEAYATAHKNLGDIYSAQAADAYNRALARNEQRSTPKPELALLSQWNTADVAAGAGSKTAVVPKDKTASKLNTQALPEATPVVEKQAAPVVAKVEPKIEAKPEVVEKAPAPQAVKQAQSGKPAKGDSKLSDVVAAAEAAGAKVAYTQPAEEADKASKSGKAAVEVAKPAAKSKAEQTEAKVAKAALPLIAPEQAEQAAKAIENWAAAWRSQNADAYIASYADFFRPENGMSHDDWAEQRRARISSPKYIRVGLKSLRIRLKGEGRAVATFGQDYQSDTYQDTVNKTLYLENIKGDWRIVREVSQ